MEDFSGVMRLLGQAASELGITHLDDGALVAARRLQTGGVLVQMREHRFLISDGAAHWLHTQLGRTLAQHANCEIV